MNAPCRAHKTKAGLPDPAFAACTYRASFPQPVGGRLPTNRQLCASSRQSPPDASIPRQDAYKNISVA
jgi:hypothetical protein